MHRSSTPAARPATLTVAERVRGTLERFLRTEAFSGILLMIAAAVALFWANAPFGDSYERFWHAPVTFGFAGYVIEQPLHFFVNDALMTVFFLVVGMEVRRELHEGALASVKAAVLPMAAALGGVVSPALIYLALNTEPITRAGWATATATDIAFAVGVLALLGKAVPTAVRIFLLAIAIIDDVIAVAIIAVFYSDGLNTVAFSIAGAGVLLVLAMQRFGIGFALAYVVPGAVVWFGILAAGAHPALAGVVLGLLTPVVASQRTLHDRLDAALGTLRDLVDGSRQPAHDPHALLASLRDLSGSERDLVPPVVRVERTLHPWVAFGVMPLFALANAGVNVSGIDLASEATRSVLVGIVVALVVGKPLGITLASYVAIRIGMCRLPAGLTWKGVALVGCLGGIGFTMSIFIATLAFADASLLAAAKGGVLCASVVAGLVGLTFGRLLIRREPAPPLDDAYTANDRSS